MFTASFCPNPASGSVVQIIDRGKKKWFSDHRATLPYGSFRLRGTELLHRLDTSGVSWNTLPGHWNSSDEISRQSHWFFWDGFVRKKQLGQGTTIHTTYIPQTTCKGKGKDIKCNSIKHLQDSETRTTKVCAWTKVVLEQNLHPVELEPYPGSRITLLVQEETTKTVASSYPVAYWHHTNSVCLRRRGGEKRETAL